MPTMTYRFSTMLLAAALALPAANAMAAGAKALGKFCTYDTCRHRAIL
mgnify:CR=1 FL=1